MSIEENLGERISHLVPEPGRQLQERWVGETRFELRESASPENLKPVKSRRKNQPSGVKRKAEEPLQPEGAVLSEVPELQQPGTRRPATGYTGGDPSSGAGVTSTACSVQECVLPRGYKGPHRDHAGGGFA